MNNIDELENITSLCRICLTRSKNMISLNMPLPNVEKNNLIVDVLEEVVGRKIIRSNGYPTAICPMCLGLLKISHNLKVQFNNSEKMLLRHFKDTLNPLSKEEISNENYETVVNVSVEPSPVEIIVGPNKYDLKDILIVEEEKSDRVNFKGFLNNLGKTITAKLVRKSNNILKNVHEEEPVVLIDKIQCPVKNNVNCLDQCVIAQEDENLCTQSSDRNVINNLNLEKLGLENLTDVDQELFRSALNMQLKCNICDKLYSSRGRFKRHLESCGKLKQHVIIDENGVHAVTATLKCHLCPRTFKQKKFLNYHIKTAHSVVPLKYECEICSQILRNRNALTYHKLTKHGERKFVCDICDKKFFTSNGLKTHILSHTQNIAQCVCPVCGKTFHYKGGLFYHMKLHTNERKYSCEFCDRKFYTLNAKKRHTLTHTGIRPYECKYCDKRFFSTGEVRKHEYLHTGVRPYSCQYCKKGFSSSYNMKVHLVSHPGPYACKLCDKTFVNMTVLQYHNKTKHSLIEEAADNLLSSDVQCS